MTIEVESLAEPWQNFCNAVDQLGYYYQYASPTTNIIHIAAAHQFLDVLYHNTFEWSFNVPVIGVSTFCNQVFTFASHLANAAVQDSQPELVNQIKAAYDVFVNEVAALIPSKRHADWRVHHSSHFLVDTSSRIVSLQHKNNLINFINIINHHVRNHPALYREGVCILVHNIASKKANLLEIAKDCDAERRLITLLKDHFPNVNITLEPLRESKAEAQQILLDMLRTNIEASVSHMSDDAVMPQAITPVASGAEGRPTPAHAMPQLQSSSHTAASMEGFPGALVKQQARFVTQDSVAPSARLPTLAVPHQCAVVSNARAHEGTSLLRPGSAVRHDKDWSSRLAQFFHHVCTFPVNPRRGL
jgi:hypothetical protein